MRVPVEEQGIVSGRTGVRAVHRGDPIRAVMATSLVGVDATASAREVAAQLSDAEVGALIVDNGRQPPGIVSERDVVRAVARGADLDELRAVDLEAPETVWAETTDSIRAVAGLMAQADVRHIPVRSDGQPAGMASIRDVLAVLLAD